jgi:hypothetical protein
MRNQRGLTLVSLLMLLSAVGGIYWMVAFGPAYWDNFEVKSVLNEAANHAYREKHDSQLRAFVNGKLHERFETGEVDERGTRMMRILYDINDDLRIEFTERPPSVELWFNYQRRVPLPLIGRERTVAFSVHADQDLSVVKW